MTLSVSHLHPQSSSGALQPLWSTGGSAKGKDTGVQEGETLQMVCVTLGVCGRNFSAKTITEIYLSIHGNCSEKARDKKTSLKLWGFCLFLACCFFESENISQLIPD